MAVSLSPRCLRLWLLAGCLLLLSAFSSVQGSRFAFKLRSRAEECFLEDVDARASDNKMMVRFGILEPKSYDFIDVKIKTPSGKSVESWNNTQHAHVTSIVRETGLYQLCFTKRRGASAEITVYYSFDFISTGSVSMVVYPNIAATVDANNPDTPMYSAMALGSAKGRPYKIGILDFDLSGVSSSILHSNTRVQLLLSVDSVAKESVEVGIAVLPQSVRYPLSWNSLDRDYLTAGYRERVFDNANAELGSHLTFDITEMFTSKINDRGQSLSFCLFVSEDAEATIDGMSFVEPDYFPQIVIEDMGLELMREVAFFKERVFTLKGDISYILQRERGSRNAAESANSRVKWLSLITNVVLVGIALAQVLLEHIALGDSAVSSPATCLKKMNAVAESGEDYRVLTNAQFDELATNITSCDAIAQLESPFVRREQDGWTLLHLFVDRESSEEILRCFVDIGIPVHIGDQDGWTPLHIAAKRGHMVICKLLVSLGAKLDAKAKFDRTPLCAASFSGNADLVLWMLEQQGPSREKWDDYVFSAMMRYTPEAVIAFLDTFAIERAPGRYGGVSVEYFDLRLVYGDPEDEIDNTALAIAVQWLEHKNVLSHRIMRHIMDVKWDTFVRKIFLKELSAYIGLLLSYYATAICMSPDWIDLHNQTDYGVVVLRVFAWLCCLYLVVVVEYNEFRGGNYLKSFWNWLNMITYGTILASIPFEFIGASTSSVRHGLLALITISLWINMLQYLRISENTGLLIATMGRMLYDVGQFFVLYGVFLLGFSGALHLILHGAVGYKSFTDTFITVLLMLFGNLTYDPYNNATGWKWFFSNLLLFVYLICVMVMLLNILIAMLSKSYALITEAAEEQYWIRNAETILRIERTLPLGLRKKQYVQLIADTTYSGADAVADIAAKQKRASMKSMLKRGIERQNTVNKISPLQAIPVEIVAEAFTDLLPARLLHANAADIKPSEHRKLKPLEDGIRIDWSAKSSRKAKLSPELEARFDSLTTAVNAEMLSLATAVNMQMAAQISELTAIIMELQRLQGGQMIPSLDDESSSTPKTAAWRHAGRASSESILRTTNSREPQLVVRQRVRASLASNLVTEDIRGATPTY